MSPKGSPSDTERLIEVGANPLERAVLTLAYSTEALPSEIANFCVSDIRWRAEGLPCGCIVIQSAQRSLPLDQRTLRRIAEHIRHNRPKHWLFEKAGGLPYKADDILSVLNRLAERAKFRAIEAMGEPLAAHFVIRDTDPKLLDQIEPVPSDPVAQYAHLKAAYDQWFQHPSDEITRREEEIERLAVEKIESALAKKAGK